MRIPLLLATALLAACSRTAPPPPAPTQADIALAETVHPADAALAAKYARSCQLCHSVAGTGAPLAGHRSSWQPRVDARGIDGLMASVHGGRGAMPARGQCPDCSDADYRALIHFLSGGAA